MGGSAGEGKRGGRNQNHMNSGFQGELTKRKAKGDSPTGLKVAKKKFRLRKFARGSFTVKRKRKGPLLRERI